MRQYMQTMCIKFRDLVIIDLICVSYILKIKKGTTLYKFVQSKMFLKKPVLKVLLYILIKLNSVSDCK